MDNLISDQSMMHACLGQARKATGSALTEGQFAEPPAIIVGGPDEPDILRPAMGRIHDLHVRGTQRGLRRPHIRGHHPALRPRISAQIHSP